MAGTPPATLCLPPVRENAAWGGVFLALQIPSTRRDKRYALRPGAGFVEIPLTIERSRPISAPILKLSASGVAFEVPGAFAGIAAGTTLADVELRIGTCVLRGDILVRDVRPLRSEGGEAAEVGGLFLPENREVESRLMALLAGIAAAE